MVENSVQWVEVFPCCETQVVWSCELENVTSATTMTSRWHFNFEWAIPLTIGAVVGLTADETRGRRVKTKAGLIKIWIWEMFFLFRQPLFTLCRFFFTKRDSFSALRTIDLHRRRPDSLADWGLKRLPKKQRFSSRPTLICPIAARRRSNIPSASGYG